jgi:PPK2 family polyphosphate:nucleotide phosphotransferase
MNYDRLIVPPGKRIRLKDYDPGYTGKFSSKEEAAGKLQSDIVKLAALQDVLYAQDTYALLLIFQAMDAAGKDGAIKHVMSGVNPQGCQVVSFKTPSAEELDHDYLWRSMKQAPERGRIGIFNRSYYEEVLVVRVHPEILHNQKIPPALLGRDIWKQRFEQINAYEQHLTRNGTVILKFFLNVSNREQKKRFLERIDTPEKNWKFSPADVRERAFWKDYMKAYEDVFNHTSTDWAPWHIIPADRKWFTRTAVADIIIRKLESLSLKYPAPDPAHLKGLKEARANLEEKDKSQ